MGRPAHGFVQAAVENTLLDEPHGRRLKRSAAGSVDFVDAQLHPSTLAAGRRQTVAGLIEPNQLRQAEIH
jgi:hypothetical protein